MPDRMGSRGTGAVERDRAKGMDLEKPHCTLVGQSAKGCLRERNLVRGFLGVSCARGTVKEPASQGGEGIGYNGCKRQEMEERRGRLPRDGRDGQVRGFGKNFNPNRPRAPAPLSWGKLGGPCKPCYPSPPHNRRYSVNTPVFSVEMTMLRPTAVVACSILVENLEP